MLDGSNKELVAEALVVKKGFNLSVDFVLSKFVPSNVVLGCRKLLFKSNSIFLRCGEKFLVEVFNFSKLRNGAKKKKYLNKQEDITRRLSIHQFHSFYQQQTRHQSWII